MVSSSLRNTALIQIAVVVMIHAMTAVPCLGSECARDTGNAPSEETPCTASCMPVSCGGGPVCGDPAGTADTTCNIPGFPYRCDSNEGCPVWCSTPCTVSVATRITPAFQVETLTPRPPEDPSSIIRQPDPPPPKSV